MLLNELYMMRKLSYIMLFLCLIACNRDTATDKYQNNRNIKVNVKFQIKEIAVNENDVLIGRTSRVYLLKDYLLIADFRSSDKFIHIFDNRNFKYLCSIGDRGEGPTELANPGHIATDTNAGKFYVTDIGKMKIFSFDIDSVLKDPINYVPGTKARINAENFPTEYEYVSDSLCIGRSIAPIGVGDYTPSVSKWNMITGKITTLSAKAPKIDHKRVVCASSAKYSLAAEIYSFYDLISIFDFEGNLKCNIHGPEWGNRGSKKKQYYSWGIFCRDNKFIVSHFDDKTDYPTQLIIFDINGNYIKTLEIGYMIQHFCYDEENDRLIFAFDDDIQFGYLNLNNML